MERYILLFTLFVFSQFQTKVSAQDTVRLGVNRLEPRVGDDVPVYFSLDFLSEDFMRQLPSGVEMQKPTTFCGNRTKVFLEDLVFTEPGMHTIGPFHFELNGKQVVTDSITLNVLPPIELKEGVWVRHLHTDSNDYIIIEQMIREDSYYIKHEWSVSPLERPETGIELQLTRSFGNTRYSSDSSQVYKYKFSRYKVVFGEDSGGVFHFGPEDLTNLPLGVEIRKIKIKKS